MDNPKQNENNIVPIKTIGKDTSVLIKSPFEEYVIQLFNYLENEKPKQIPFIEDIHNAIEILYDLESTGKLEWADFNPDINSANLFLASELSKILKLSQIDKDFTKNENCLEFWKYFLENVIYEGILTTIAPQYIRSLFARIRTLQKEKTLLTSDFVKDIAKKAHEELQQYFKPPPKDDIQNFPSYAALADYVRGLQVDEEKKQKELRKTNKEVRGVRPLIIDEILNSGEYLVKGQTPVRKSIENALNKS